MIDRKITAEMLFSALAERSDAGAYSEYLSVSLSSETENMRASLDGYFNLEKVSEDLNKILGLSAP